MGYIYKIVNKIDKKTYIGKTKIHKGYIWKYENIE